MFTAVQNPVDTALWLSAMIQLMVIPISLMVEVWPFCKSPLQCKPFVLLESVYIVLTLLVILAGPAHRANVFHLSLFPEAFRGQQLGIMLETGMIVAVTRRLLGKRLRRRITPI